MPDAARAQIVQQLLALVKELAPDVSVRPMYGGTVLELKKGEPASRVGGIFEYADHVSLEFTHGASFDDPGSLLEGAGKARRHIKLRTEEEVSSKGCRRFLNLALLCAR